MNHIWTRRQASPSTPAQHEVPLSMVPKIVQQVTGSAGQPLELPTRSLMESRFSHDFSTIRIHTGARAAASARSVDALAYTVGRDIVFREDSYKPATTQGQRLIAHELAHTLQASEQSAGVVQRQVASGMEMWQERADPDVEAQRLEAFNIIRDNRGYMNDEAAKYKIPAEAIAGAILWEALENQYKFKLRPASTRYGPGKIHTGTGSEAEKVEKEGRIKTTVEGGPLAKLPANSGERDAALQNAKVAITYIAAIRRRHADNYKTIAGVDIGGDIGVLCTLYQGGHSEDRAQKLAARRQTDPAAMPQPGNEMGRWVLTNLETIRGWTNPPPRPH